MANVHNHIFFGQNIGLFISSSSKFDPFLYFRYIKKKSNGKWEKPTQGEGKVIKFTLEEIVIILQVLKRDILDWQIFHYYKNEKTQITFNWENKNTKTLWISVSNYSKMLNFAQVEILRLLLTHILREKIKYATSGIHEKLNHHKQIN